MSYTGHMKSTILGGNTTNKKNEVRVNTTIDDKQGGLKGININ